jgi:ferritin
MEEFKKYRKTSLAEEYGVKELEDMEMDQEIENEPAQVQEVPVKEIKGVKIPNTLDSEVEKTLNERLGDEYTAYYFYRNAANWCKNMNYKKAASFFNSEAEGELGHAQGIQDYLTQWNLIPEIPQVPTVYKFENLVEIIDKAYDLEYNLLQKYSENQKELLNVHPATFNFIQKYVDIQNGEVEEYSDFLNALQLVNSENKFELLYFENTYF